MMFLEHDFYSNFSQSLQSGDQKLTRDIISDELSELIVHDYDKVFDLLDKVGVRANPKMSDEQLVDLLLKEMQTNPKLIKGLAFLISEKNDLINSETDDRSGKKYVEYVNKNLQKSLDKILSNENETRKFKNDLMSRVGNKDSKVAERRRKVETPNHFWRNTFIVVGVLGVAYLIYKNWDKITGQESSQMGAGGTTIPEADLSGAAAGKVNPDVEFTPPVASGNSAAQSIPSMQP